MKSLYYSDKKMFWTIMFLATVFLAIAVGAIIGFASTRNNDFVVVTRSGEKWVTSENLEIYDKDDIIRYEVYEDSNVWLREDNFYTLLGNGKIVKIYKIYYDEDNYKFAVRERDITDRD